MMNPPTRVLVTVTALVVLIAAPPLRQLLAAQSELVIHVEGTKLYHFAGCPLLERKDGILALTRAQAESRGFKPHADCDPANPKAAPTGRGGKPEPPPTVYLDGSKYYHRKTCSRIEGDGTRIKPASLEAAGKSHWPCPACKPPIRSRNTEPAVPGTGRRGR